jgi:hypothetical protein
MKHLTRFSTAILTCIGLGACGSAARGGVIVMPPPGPARVAKADAVIVGTVDGIEPQDVKVGNTTYRIAVVRINQGLKGIKDEKTLRIGFIPLEMPKPMVIVTGARPVQLKAGQEGLFILSKQAKENFYTIGGVVGYYINSDKNKEFEKEVQVAKAAAKVTENPQAALKAKDADERLLAAAILIEKYRSFRPNAKQEPIDAQESKLILQALADADWQTPWNFTSLRSNPGQLFQRLGVTAKDGFTVPQGANYQAAAQTWVRENAQKYRIQRFVASEAK